MFIRALFYGGFFMLPWLWLVNYLLFRKYFKRRSTPPEVKWCILINNNTGEYF